MKNNQPLFLDVHAIQTVPPSNINRDDTGSPKTAQYGGVTRSRVSSQSWKRAIRQYFLDHGGMNNVGIRSLEIVRYIAEKIVDIDESIAQETAMELAEKTLNSAGVSTKDKKARALFFISSKQADKLAQAAIEGEKSKMELQELLKDDPAIDISLFGRMVADDPKLNEDASSQVAHAISTHEVQTEFDFFTATDDFSSANDAGAGMLGTIEYNSSTLYRYANVAVHEFGRQIGDQTLVVNALKLFVEAFVKSMPTGKINTFANQTLPQALLICLREDRPISLVSAYEQPIRSSEGYVTESVKRLNNEYESVMQWVDKPLFSFSLGMDDFVGNQDDIKQLLDKMEESLNTLLDS
ncbi:MAG TPA: type I-E CRISPR-associated protein Cas7/Cse4/CasC [Thermoclostridium sp.]|nr:type I-E CRISPR-associated protein Cas7/Cse4/CasC [Thermoclostridium sp.]